jgi:hypothetical protein
MFWQGGFTFYAAVVVPVGQEVLGSHLEQGFITRQVTTYLNLAGAIALVLLAWDTIGCKDGVRIRRRARRLSWIGMAVALLVLIWLHEYLEGLLDLEARELYQPKAFRSGHRWYLWISTVQWGLGVLFAALTLIAWRAEDRMGNGEPAAS